MMIQKHFFDRLKSDVISKNKFEPLSINIKISSKEKHIRVYTGSSLPQYYVQFLAVHQVFTNLSQSYKYSLLSLLAVTNASSTLSSCTLTNIRLSYRRIYLSTLYSFFTRLTRCFESLASIQRCWKSFKERMKECFSHQIVRVLFLQSFYLQPSSSSICCLTTSDSSLYSSCKVHARQVAVSCTLVGRSLISLQQVCTSRACLLMKINTSRL